MSGTEKQNHQFQKRGVLYAVVCLCVFFLGQVSGIVLCRMSSKKEYRKSLTEVRSKDQRFQFISPLLECEAAEDLIEFSEGSPSRKRLTDIIDREKRQGDIGSVSVYFRDLNNGPWLGINEREWFAPASLLKVPLAMMLYRAKDADSGYLSKELTLESSGNVVSANFGEAGALQIGQKYSVEALIDRMLANSDNDAAYTIMEQLMPLERAHVLYEDLYIETLKNAAGEEGLSVRDYSGLFRVLYNASYLSKESSEKILGILSNSTYKNGLVAGLPDGTVVSHKFGERDESGVKQLHDCGIVYAPEHPYILCVMTKGDSFESQARLISDISKSVYEDVLLSQKK